MAIVAVGAGSRIGRGLYSEGFVLWEWGYKFIEVVTECWHLIGDVSLKGYDGVKEQTKNSCATIEYKTTKSIISIKMANNKINWWWKNSQCRSVGINSIQSALPSSLNTRGGL